MTSLDFSIPDSKTQLTIDPEFKALIPPLTTEERELLESSLKSEGCRDALVVWKDHNTLIDGHNRHELCTKNTLPYQTIEREFETREDVIVWIARNQMARRNISDFTRGRLALKAEKPLVIDYLAYAFMPTKKVYMLDWLTLRRTWAIYGEQWKKTYRTVIAPNRNYKTHSCPVPIPVLLRAMNAAMVIDLSVIEIGVAA